MHCYLNIFLLLLVWNIFPIAVSGQETPETVASANETASLPIPKILLEPATEEELAQHDILFAISQRDYKLAEQLFEIASLDDDRKQLIVNANFGTQLRGLSSFWKSIEAGLQRVKVGDELELSRHLIGRNEDLATWHSQNAKQDQSSEDFNSTATNASPEEASGSDKISAPPPDLKPFKATVVEKKEFSLTLSNLNGDKIEVATKQNQIPTAVAVALFRFQFPNSAVSATALFERFDFPGNARLLTSKSTDSQNSASSLPRTENQTADKGARIDGTSASRKNNDARLPIPAEADQKKSRLEIRRLFDTLYTGKTQQNIQERARKLLQVAKETDPTTNAADLYVLLEEALSAAASIADINLSLSISSEIANRFQVDPDATFISMAKNVLSKVREPNSAESMLGEIRSRVDDWINDDDYAMAKKALTEFSPLIRRLRLPHWAEYVADEQVKIRTLSKKHAELVASIGDKISQQTLANEPSKSIGTWPAPEKLTGPQCELIAQFLIFDKGNLENGLPYLARSSSENLRGIADLESKPPQTVDEKIALAEKWLEIEDQPFAIERARSIYSEILSTATGLTEARVRKKLESIQGGQKSKISMRDFIGVPLTLTWVYIDGSGSKDETETLIFLADGTYTRKQPSVTVTGTWTESEGNVEAVLISHKGRTDTYKLLPGGNIMGIHYIGSKAVQRCHGKLILQK
jgi:hypothetical protein